MHVPAIAQGSRCPACHYYGLPGKGTSLLVRRRGTAELLRRRHCCCHVALCLNRVLACLGMLPHIIIPLAVQSDAVADVSLYVSGQKSSFGPNPPAWHLHLSETDAYRHANNLAARRAWVEIVFRANLGCLSTLLVFYVTTTRLQPRRQR